MQIKNNIYIKNEQLQNCYCEKQFFAKKLYAQK